MHLGKPRRRRSQCEFARKEFGGDEFEFGNNRTVVPSDSKRTHEPYRPDILFRRVPERNGMTWRVVVECDEFQHRGLAYECDMRRVSDIAEELGEPVRFIRLNTKERNKQTTLAAAIRHAFANPPKASVRNFSATCPFYTSSSRRT